MKKLIAIVLFFGMTGSTRAADFMNIDVDGFESKMLKTAISSYIDLQNSNENPDMGPAYPIMARFMTINNPNETQANTIRQLIYKNFTGYSAPENVIAVGFIIKNKDNYESEASTAAIQDGSDYYDHPLRDKFVADFAKLYSLQSVSIYSISHGNDLGGCEGVAVVEKADFNQIAILQTCWSE